MSEFDKAVVTYAEYIVAQRDTGRRHIERIKVKTFAKPIARVFKRDVRGKAEAKFGFAQLHHDAMCFGAQPC
jgi:hypothetical protein